jgi:hypothetical protein
MEKNWYHIHIYDNHSCEVEFLSRKELNEKYLNSANIEAVFVYVELLLSTGKKRPLTFFNKRMSFKVRCVARGAFRKGNIFNVLDYL